MPGRTVMSRRAFLEATDRLIADGERLIIDPDWNLFRLWLLNSDELLERVWGRMDRYHLAWLNVGRDSAPGIDAGRGGDPPLRDGGGKREAGGAAYDEDGGRGPWLVPAERRR